MKYSILTLISLAACALTATAEPKKPADKAVEKPAAEKADEAKKPAVAADSTKKMPFFGEIKEVDAKAGTFLVGKRTFTLTPASELIMSEKPAKAADVAVGLVAGGSYAKKGDVLEVHKLTLKTKEEAAATKAAKKDAASRKTAEAKEEVKETPKKAE